jgi:hypothetical protein
MKTFDVYKHPTLGYAAVKRGFSWPGFFLGGIWALSKRMWVGGSILVVVWAILVGAQSDADTSGDIGTKFILGLIQLALAVAVGMLGNRRSADSLTRRGYEHLGTVEGQEPDWAIATFVKKSDVIT